MLAFGPWVRSEDTYSTHLIGSEPSWLVDLLPLAQSSSISLRCNCSTCWNAASLAFRSSRQRSTRARITSRLLTTCMRICSNCVCNAEIPAASGSVLMERNDSSPSKYSCCRAEACNGDTHGECITGEIVEDFPAASVECVLPVSRFVVVGGAFDGLAAGSLRWLNKTDSSFPAASSSSPLSSSSSSSLSSGFAFFFAFCFCFFAFFFSFSRSRFRASSSSSAINSIARRSRSLASPDRSSRRRCRSSTED
mmetsp:Transcript_35667/g.86633  ORF Transcript_35667/g.86633 Transcript_35667/m.86633 type:complete len:251 (+) Transcript_35667:265-1017(+)